jgi:tetratricopeptide (TPR) repeat protein
MLVGREQELNALNAHYKEMLSGKGSILFLAGEAGLGKTTLVHEWRNTVPPDEGIYVEAACSIPIGGVDVGAMEALQPWADAIAQLQGHAEKDKKKFDLKKLIHDAAPAWAWAIPFVGDVAHAAVETHRLIKEQRGDADHNPNASNQQQVFQQYVNFLTKISVETPLVIFIDDMHWADASSTSLLFYLSRQITEKKILIIAAYRPDEALSADKGAGHPVIKVKNEILRYGTGKELSLGFLGIDAIRELLVKTFPGYVIDDKFEYWLRKISEGNSLFVTQYIKTLNEDGHLTEHGAFTGSYENIAIPGSALAVVTERMRRLDDAQRELLCYATAEGEEFTAYVLEQLTKKDMMTMLQELQYAEKAGVIREKGFGRFYANQMTAFFGFSHALFHKALYDSMLSAQRQYLHRQCYELLKAIWDGLAKTKDHSMPLASKLLMHAEKCGEYEFAANVALASASAAWEEYSESEALGMLGHVARLANTTVFPVARRAALLGEASLLRSNIDSLHGRFDDALKAATDAFDHFQTLRNEQRCAASLNRRAAIYYHQAEYDSSEDEARKALALVEKCNDAKEQAEALRGLGIVCERRGIYDEALEYCKRSLAIWESTGDRHGIARTLNNIGNVYHNRGEYEESLTYHKKSLAIWESVGDRKEIARLLYNTGSVYHNRGENDEALECCTRSLKIYESIGDRIGISNSQNSIGFLFFERGEYDEALGYFHKNLTVQEATGDRNGIAGSLNNIGLVQFSRGNLDDALAYFTRALGIAEEIGARMFQANTIGNIANIYFQRGSYSEALEYHKRNLAIRESLGDKVGMAIGLTDSGSCYCFLGLYDDAITALTQCLKLAEETGNRYVRSRGLNGIGEVHFARGEYDSAVGYFEQALAQAEEGKTKPEQYNSIHNLGKAYWKLGDYRKSRDFLERALIFTKEMKLAQEESIVSRELELLTQEEESQIVITPKSGPIESEDEVFLRNVAAAINDAMSDEKFDVETLAGKVGMSRVHLHRKLSALTEQSASDLIRSMRLDRAMLMLKRNAATVSEAAYAVGFGDPSYFAKCFREKFGMAPGEARGNEKLKMKS